MPIAPSETRHHTSPVGTEAALSVRGVYKVFGRRPGDAVRRLAAGATRDEVREQGSAAVIGASFDVRPGEIFVVMGLSGSGKSTLIRMLNGLLEPSAGSVEIGERTVTKASAKEIREIRRSSVSMVFQHFALLPHRTVLENVAFGLEVNGVDRTTRLAKAREVIDLVGLDVWADAKPDELSGGMQQRVGIARALAAETDVLLMDEAFSALDPLIRREMQEQLVDLQQRLGKTIVFITHDLNEAMFLGDRIAVMRDGRIVQIGSPEDILTDPANDYVAQFVQDVDRARVLTAASVMEPARAVVPLTAGPRGALRVMRDLQTAAVFVTGRGRTLDGWVRDRHVMRQVKAGDTNLDAIVNTEYARVTPDTSLTDLFELAVESPLPIAVVDAEGRLLGVVPRVTLLAALGNVPTATMPIPVLEPVTRISDSDLDATLATGEQSIVSDPTIITTDRTGADA
ncbi:glycine betaine/L-proline ABC transporter ATP-binding protein [Curtobacterium sp. MCSS17_016]|uniref:quaternary amine ABC transporter ATP-binding protein n=1 Tax=Curtobacterium sp. MCSS17_016 TaxID=2175644 RepID=UPI0021AC2FBD|nr:glycine betaine/L-proline ABC transporter ATP-binding protein [Curtobacterium sp. MCSS17_016]WIE80542.1 glycine betaine/L-proline ABC transporter ATP-binding protein [Curtobacterium sp. MCSS17_016]